MLVGLTEIGARARQARVRGRPPIEGGAGRLHERARDHDHRRPAAEVVRVLDPRRLVPGGGEGVRRRPRRTQSRDARRRASRCSSVLLVLPRLTTKLPAVLVAVVGATVASAVLGLAARRRRQSGLAAGRSHADGALDYRQRRPAAADRGGGITLVSLTDTIATAASFAARRGEEVEPDQEMIGIGAANIAAGSSRASRCRPAARAPRSPNSRVREAR